MLHSSYIFFKGQAGGPAFTTEVNNLAVIGFQQVSNMVGLDCCGKIQRENYCLALKSRFPQKLLVIAGKGNELKLVNWIRASLGSIKYRELMPHREVGISRCAGRRRVR